MPPALSVQSVGKRFARRDTRRPQTFRKFVEGGFQMPKPQPFWALRDITFDVPEGEMLGVIGRNGSGKSTLLRLLGGVMGCDEGHITAAAPVNGLLELNTGMHPDLTGRENARISGVLAGLLQSEVDTRLESILDFAELTTVADEPFRTYSTGMRLRLGFSVAVHIDPKILLIDEVLAVGDIGFQQKCLDRINRFRQDGCAIVLVSHDLHVVETMCTRALWLDGGRAKALGAPVEVAQAYRHAMRDKTLELAPEPPAEDSHFGTQEARITAVALTDATDTPTRIISTGEALTISMQVTADTPISALQANVSISNAAGDVLLDVNTATDHVVLPELAAPYTVLVHLARLDLAPGRYTVSVGLHEENWDHTYDFLADAARFEITEGSRLKGWLAPPRTWRVTSD